MQREKGHHPSLTPGKALRLDQRLVGFEEMGFVPFLMSKDNGHSRTDKLRGKEVTTRPSTLSDQSVQCIQVGAVPGLIMFAVGEDLVPVDQFLASLNAMQVALHRSLLFQQPELPHHRHFETIRCRAWDVPIP